MCVREDILGRETSRVVEEVLEGEGLQVKTGLLGVMRLEEGKVST